MDPHGYREHRQADPSPGLGHWLRTNWDAIWLGGIFFPYAVFFVCGFAEYADLFVIRADAYLVLSQFAAGVALNTLGSALSPYSLPIKALLVVLGVVLTAICFFPLIFAMAVIFGFEAT